MSLRLLALLYLLFLSQVSLSRKSETVTEDVPAMCPVTMASDQRFIPPWPYPKTPYPGGYWFGTDRLWIAPPTNGMWSGYFTSTDPVSGNKKDW